MRSFVAATCCLIVGLEILIGVPVAICLGFLCLGTGTVPGVQLAEAQYVGPTCPPPLYSAPVGYSPGPLPCGPYDPSYPPSSISPATCPAPVAPPVVASLPASDSAADPLPWRAKPAPPSDGPQFLAHVCLEGDCPGGQCASANLAQNASAEAVLADSLLTTAYLLYQQADRHEEETEYDLADRFRSLARDLRQESFSIDRRSPDYNTAPVVEPAPASSADPWQPPASASPAQPAPVEEPRTVTVGPPPLG